MGILATEKQEGLNLLNADHLAVPGVISGIMENKMETTIVYWGYIGIKTLFCNKTERFGLKACETCVPRDTGFCIFVVFLAWANGCPFHIYEG